MNPHLDHDRHPISDPAYVDACRAHLDAEGALVLEGFFTPQAIARAVAESEHREHEAFFAASTHNVYLTPRDPELPDGHTFNRQVVSSKGLIADDQIDPDSPLRGVYDDPTFRAFLCGVLGIDEIHPYADPLSSINVHFAADGQELGWHFDNSSFAVTMLLRSPDAGGAFEYVPSVRDADAGDMAFDLVAGVLDGNEPVQTLAFDPGALVLFRGRNAMHRVTPTQGNTTRLLVVFAFNDTPGVGLSESALTTFYGRTA
ncbi:MAG: HalD/BesD family halogenase [Acidimicrobiales bacterium]